MIRVTSDYLIDLKKVESYLASSEEEDKNIGNYAMEDKLRFSLDGLLNDYYEDEIKNLPLALQKIARSFIEDGLIVADRRVGMNQGVEKALYQVEEDLLNLLLESRLIRAENTHLGRSFEVSHDALVEPILKSKRERKAKEEQEEAKRELRAYRRRLFQVSGVAAVSLALLVLAIIFYLQANRAKKKAEKSEAKSVKSEELATQARDSIIIVFDNFRKAQLESIRSRYQSFVSSGDASMARSEYIQAINAFQSAKQTIDNYVEDVKDENMRDSIDNGGQKAEEGIKLASDASGAANRFATLIQQGDQFMRRGERYYVNAKSAYQSAFNLDYDNRLAKGKLDEIAGKLETAFGNFKKNGDIYFRAKDYNAALDNYNQAKRIKPADDYINRQIKLSKAGG